MSLQRGAEIATNIGELINAGHPPAQAAAIAYRYAEGEDRAAGIAYRAGDSVLLLLRSPSCDDFPLTWCFPGGGIDEGETPEQAAIRESVEETGHTPATPLRLIDWLDGFTTYAVDVEAPFVPTLNGEHLGYVWVPLASLPRPMHPGCELTLVRAPLAAPAVLAMDDWVTVENGEHVLLGEGGNIVGGLGGKGHGAPISALKSESKSTAPNASSGEAHSSAKSTFTAEEKRGISDYSSDETKPSEGRFKPAYQEINTSLRTDGKAPTAHSDTVKALDKSFDSAGAKEPFTVYRGVSKEFADKLSAGSGFTDKGFSSTTSDVSVAKEFTGSGGVLMHISIPKGGKALSLQKVSKYPDEKEVLLNRGGKYKVKSESRDDRGNRVLHVEYQG